LKSSVVINADLGQHTISRHIYGHFAEHLGRCIYGGVWVGEESPVPNTRGIRNDVVEALRNIKIPNLRWPGGCFADEYHWKDGIGPKEERPSMINTHWGGVVENNHFGTHEFMDLCEQLECEPYICGNVGSGTVQEMQEWVEYLTFDGESPMANLRRKNGRQEPWKLKYFGIGNENWGCGGRMRAEYYADVYRQYQTYVRNFAGNSIHKIACGASEADYHWTEVMMRECAQGSGLSNHEQPLRSGWEYYRPQMAGLSFHYYTRNRLNYTPATQFGEDLWFEYLKRTLYMEDLIKGHSAIMDKYDPDKNVGLIIDEWGTWFKVEPGTPAGFLYQQNTLRDALVAGINLNIFNNHCDRVHMTNIAQTINVLQSMILTQEDQMVLTPSYHVFEMYKVHHDAKLLPIHIEGSNYSFDNDSIPSLSVSASQDGEGKIHISYCNLDPNESEEIFCDLRGGKEIHKINGRILTSDQLNAHNTFEQPENIVPVNYNNFNLQSNGFSFTLPPKSILVVEIA
jgi:alpha-L-arabinofuranosidase